MTPCSECGAPLDPTVTHTQHVAGCLGFTFTMPNRDWDCECPEVCAGCCTDPDCPLRAQP